jgi:hypothetical protein
MEWFYPCTLRFFYDTIISPSNPHSDVRRMDIEPIRGSRSSDSISLACAECEDSLPFSEAYSVPPFHILFPTILLHQLFFHPSSLHRAIYFLVYSSCFTVGPVGTPTVGTAAYLLILLPCFRASLVSARRAPRTDIARDLWQRKGELWARNGRLNLAYSCDFHGNCKDFLHS